MFMFESQKDLPMEHSCLHLKMIVRLARENYQNYSVVVEMALKILLKGEE